MMSGFKPITEKDVYVLDEDKDGTYIEPYRQDMLFKSDVLSALAGLREELEKEHIKQNVIVSYLTISEMLDFLDKWFSFAKAEQKKEVE